MVIGGLVLADQSHTVKEEGQDEQVAEEALALDKKEGDDPAFLPLYILY